MATYLKSDKNVRPEVYILSEKSLTKKSKGIMKLVRFLMNLPTLTNQAVTVELKNGNSVNGTILLCLPLMNLSLKNIKLSQPNQDPQLLSYINIRGNQIRQIILPDDLDVEMVLLKSVSRIKGLGAGPGIKKEKVDLKRRR